MTSHFLTKFFKLCFVFLVKTISWSKFHVNIITRSGAMTIFFYKHLTRNLEIGNIPAWVLSNIWRLEQARKTNFAQMFLINCYWMLQNVTVTAFNVFELLRENQQGVGESLPLPKLGLISWLMICKLMLQLQSSFRFACCNSDSWRRSTLKYLW